jgi:hypothetical protein
VFRSIIPATPLSHHSVLVPIPAAPRSGPSSHGGAPASGARFVEADLESSAVDSLNARVESEMAKPDGSDAERGETTAPTAADGVVGPRRSTRSRTKLPDAPVPRRRVRDRWFYEPVNVPVDPLSLSYDALPATTVQGVVPVFMVSHVSDSVSQPSAVSEPTISPVLDGSLAVAVDGFRATSLAALPPPVPPPSSLLPTAGTTGRFSINLLFPDRELPDQAFWVTTSMTVPTLKRSLADLLHVSTPLSLFVGPDWNLLDHDGFIVSPLLSDGVTPCPFLQPGSFLRVVSLLVFDSSGSSTVFGLAAPTRLVGLQSSSLELGSSNLPSDTFIGDSSLQLAQTEFLDFPDSVLVGLARPNIFSSSILHSSRDGETRGAFCIAVLSFPICKAMGRIVVRLEVTELCWSYTGWIPLLFG